MTGAAFVAAVLAGATPAEAQSFQNVVETFYGDEFRTHPIAATDIGVHDYDAVVDDLSRDGQAKNIARLQAAACRPESPVRGGGRRARTREPHSEEDYDGKRSATWKPRSQEAEKGKAQSRGRRRSGSPPSNRRGRRTIEAEEIARRNATWLTTRYSDREQGAG